MFDIDKRQGDIGQQNGDDPFHTLLLRPLLGRGPIISLGWIWGVMNHSDLVVWFLIACRLFFG